MKRLLNTLYVLSEDAYLYQKDENVVVMLGDGTKKMVPFIGLDAIYDFSYKGASPALIGSCAERGINLTFLSPNGDFLAHPAGRTHGNVLLRKEQYRISDDDKRSIEISKSMIFGKIYNCRTCIERTIRDHGLRIDIDTLHAASEMLKSTLPSVLSSSSNEELRGIEGKAASKYFDVFDSLILSQKEDFYFKARTRRPPLDRVNAMLSFGYSLLANDCASALESVGLDSYVGFMHSDRPGRVSLALDLMEELRSVLVDRFVLTLVNLKKISKADFDTFENGTVLLNLIGRKKFLSDWQVHKKEEITHPYLKEKIPWGLVPFVQATLLARYIRKDLDGYPPFLWK